MMFSLLGGVFADRLDRRKMLLASQYIQMTCAFLLAALFATHVVQVWHILTLSFIVGLGQSFGGPAYSALLPALVGPEDLSNAIAMNSIQFNLARVLGPIIGGLAYTALGATWCFVLNGLSFRRGDRFAVRDHGEICSREVDRISSFQHERRHLQFIRQRDGMSALVVLAFCDDAVRIFDEWLSAGVRAAMSFTEGRRPTRCCWCIPERDRLPGRLVVAAMEKLKGQGRLTLLILIAAGLCYGRLCDVAVAAAFVRADVSGWRGGYGVGVVHAFAGATAGHRRDAWPRDERLQPGVSRGNTIGRVGAGENYSRCGDLAGVVGRGCDADGGGGHLSSDSSQSSSRLAAQIPNN